MLYIGMTNNLTRRVYEHKMKQVEGFTKQYNLTKLVYYEHHTTATRAISREKQLKGWARKRKVELIETTNPTWVDIAEGWYAELLPVSELPGS